MNANPHYLLLEDRIMCFWKDGDLTLCAESFTSGKTWMPEREANYADLEHLFGQLQPALAC